MDSAMLEKLDKMEREMASLKIQLDAVNKRVVRSVPHASLGMQIHLAHHCNLDCYACQHFSTLSEKWFIRLDSLERQLERLSELLPDEMHGVHEIWLLGGEPLLHPDVIAVIKCVRKYFTFPKVNLTTNGILLPSRDGAFWEACRENAITLEITPYPLSIDIDAIKVNADNYGVALKGEGALGYDDVEKRKFRQGMRPFNRGGAVNPKAAWMDCDVANLCIQLLDGKLYQCAAAAYMHLLNEYFNESFKVTERDCVDIFAVQSADEIFRHLSKPIPFCRYCNHLKGMNFEWRRTGRHACEFLDWESEADDFLKNGEYDAARRLSNEILRHGAPGHAAKWAYRILLESHERENNLPEAIAAAQAWVAAEPSRALPRENLARLHRNNHELDKAERLALEYIEKHAERRGWAYRELCYINVMRGGGHLEEALRMGKKAIAEHPGHQEFQEYFQALISASSTMRQD